MVRIAGVDDREQARLLANSLVQVPKAELPALGDEDYYWHQLEGLDVYQVANGQFGRTKKIGRVDSLLETGANDVLVVQPEADFKTEAQEILIPYLLGSAVKQVDMEQGRILVDWYYD